MKLFANEAVKRLFFSLLAVMLFFFLAALFLVNLFLANFTNVFQADIAGKRLLPYDLHQSLFLGLFLFFLLMTACILAACYRYFFRQDKIMEEAVLQINAYLGGNTGERIVCDEEGELYRLFHAVNMLAAILDAHAARELRSKEFMKNIISDISHQLKTPLAALNIYNGVLLEEIDKELAKERPPHLLSAEAGKSVKNSKHADFCSSPCNERQMPASYPSDSLLTELKELVLLSEQELDRIDTLVQNLLKITRMDAGSIVFEKASENVADMMKEVELHFARRAEQEGKKVILSGKDDVALLCDRHWILEAADNLVKNALDHTKEGDSVWIEWRKLASVVQIMVKDNGSGIHPEDIHYIFKRFYRSRFSKDTKGAGLGLPLAKTIFEAHNGTVEVDSQLGEGTSFVINFLIPSKL